jgi:hypothetical protein
MADLKISAMTQPGFVMNGDLMPLVQSGANIAATRSVFLQPHAGETVGFTDGSTTVGVREGVGPVMMWKSPNQVTWTRSADIMLLIDATGNFFLNAIPGGLLGLQGNGGGIGIDSAGGIGLIPAAGQIVAIGYTPGNAGDWAPPPVDYQGAIDRIAAKLASIFGPIP